MILGMSIATFTLFHVALSLIGIGAGFIVVFGMIADKPLPTMTALFLITTAATSITGFLFPFKGITPGIVIGILSMIALLVAIVARYGRHLGRGWRGTWVISAMLALYFNFFVLIVQSFEKVPALKALAPTPAAAPFKVVQIAALLLFLALTVQSMRRFHVAVVQPA